MSKRKAVRRPQILCGGTVSSGFLRLLGRFLGGSLRLFLHFGSTMELHCHQDNSLVFLAIGAYPFLWLEVAGYSDVFAFLEAVEGVEILILAPCLYVDEG